MRFFSICRRCGFEIDPKGLTPDDCSPHLCVVCNEWFKQIQVINNAKLKMLEDTGGAEIPTDEDLLSYLEAKERSKDITVLVGEVIG